MAKCNRKIFCILNMNRRYIKTVLKERYISRIYVFLFVFLPIITMISAVHSLHLVFIKLIPPKHGEVLPFYCLT